MHLALQRGISGAIAALAALALAAPAADAVEIVDEVPIDPGAFGGYTIAPDGSFWTIGQTSGIVYNLNPDNGGIEDSFTTFSGGFFTTLGFYNDRVYAGDSPDIYSWLTESDDETDPGRVKSDIETQGRIGSNQMILRVGSNGVASLGLGQNNKAAMLDLTDLDASNPFYGQSFFGTGINEISQPDVFQACVVSGPGVVPPSSYCGKGPGKSGPASGQFGYAIDTAFGNGGVYVLELYDNEVSHIITNEAGCPCPGIKFGSGPGTAAGKLDAPFSIRQVPETGNLLISSQGNRRIDEFNSSGGYIRSFGFGVLTGEDKFETCGVDIGQCQAGVPYQSNPRSYFSQLDIHEGLLYAATPVDQSIQVISLGDGSRVSLKAAPRKVKKGKKTTLTATLEPCEDGDKALFQVKEGQGFQNVGQAIAADGDCQAERKVKVTKKSVFQAVSIDSGGTTIATSPKVTVKVK